MNMEFLKLYGCFLLLYNQKKEQVIAIAEVDRCMYCGGIIIQLEDKMYECQNCFRKRPALYRMNVGDKSGI